MTLPLKSTIYTIYLAVFAALVILLSQGVRQYQLYNEHEAIISRTESLIFQFSIIREHVSEALLDGQQSKLSGISTEMEKLNSNLTSILSEKNIGDEYKLPFLNSIDLPGIILLLRKIESGGGEMENKRNLNSEMRTLGERLILFDRVLVNHSKKKLLGFQNIIIGSSTFVVFLLVTVLTLFHRQLIVPLLQLVSKSSEAASGLNTSIDVNSPSKELTSLTVTIASLLEQRSDLQMQLQNYRQTIFELVTSLKGFFAVISRDGKIIDISSNIAEKSGFTPAELIGRQWRDFFIMPPNQADSEFSDAQLLAPPASTCQTFQMSLATKEQRPSPHIHCSFIKYPEEGNSESYQILCLGIDLSEEQTKIDELKQGLAAEINKKAEMVRVSHLAILGELSTGVAHEVSNLSNGIINYAQVLADAACDPDFEVERDKLFKKIIVEGEKIAGLAKNLLAYGQDDAQSKELAPIEDVLQNSLNLMSHYFRIDGATVETNFNSPMPYRTNGRQMQQVFLNILNNARRALNERYPQKDENKLIKISTNEIEKNGKKMIRLIFTDFGIGISAENLKKVFEPSFSTKSTSEGIGMGLTVSRELIAQHHGEIYLESQLNDHTTVTVELPVS
ncbi:MAG: ATP-binding protein [Desulfobulbaceae bacterium]|nr:ATP-binding protein [Desulfobulbaceae bacterium]